MTMACDVDAGRDAEDAEMPASEVVAARLRSAFLRESPRLNPRPATLAGVAIYAGAVALLVAAFARAFAGDGLLTWSVGVVYIAYDTALLAFVAWQTRALWAPERPAGGLSRPTLGVIVAAHNERAALTATIDALLGQTDPPDAIWLADDGSDDGSEAVLAGRYALVLPALGRLGAPSPVAPGLRWLRLPHRGKAHALNAAFALASTDVVLTVDADTLLEPDAVAMVRMAFAADDRLVVGGGVLRPRCAGGALGRVLQEFQTYEYVRNFLARNAWSRVGSLLLISGAFAAFRRDAVAAVGGFDPECWVEDYELIHRLHRHAADNGLDWRVRILGAAVARTDAPAAILPFLRQRRRWFGGFLQTQWWNRDMIAAPRFGALGLAMMPVKAFDTLQPIYGLIGLALLVMFVIGGRSADFAPAFGLMLAKIGLDVGNMALLLAAWRRWTGGRAPAGLGCAIVCLVLEPFSFQILRHLGAAWGWQAALGGATVWERKASGVSQAGPEDKAARSPGRLPRS